MCIRDSRYNLRQCLYERDKKINARLNDKRYILRKRRYNPVYDLRDRFYDCGYNLRKRGNKRRQKVDTRLNDLRDRGKQAVDQAGYCLLYTSRCV